MDLPINSSNPLGALHRPTPNIWVLELKNGSDNRLTGVVCTKVIIPALDIVEKEWRIGRNKALKADDKAGAGGALIIVGRLDQDKFFSNGFDFSEVMKTPGLGFIYNNFTLPIMTRLLSYPIPTIAALNGHTFAAAFGLAMCCDYRVMTSGKAWAWCVHTSLDLIQFGAPFPHSFSAIFQEKARDPTLVRAICLEAKKFTPQELLKHGLVDQLADGGSKGVLEAATQLGQKVGVNAVSGVFGLIKKGIYFKTLQMMNDDMRQVMPFEEDAVVLAKL
ncbi:hypothetical protein FRB90_001457 [Tulasnella sp. 427]|nr:hypothetical protein FRB90_001457 [Tulasnella sp. 427]